MVYTSVLRNKGVVVAAAKFASSAAGRRHRRRLILMTLAGRAREPASARRARTLLAAFRKERPDDIEETENCAPFLGP
jgi:hypothetical protein